MSTRRPFQRRTLVARSRLRRRAILLAAARKHVGHQPPPRRWVRIARVVGLLLTTFFGLFLGVLLGGHTTQDIGPFAAELSLSPSVHGATSVEIPPLGSLEMNTHDGPVHVTVALGSLDESRTRKLASNSSDLNQVSQDAVVQLSAGMRRLSLQTAGAGILGAMLLTGLFFRSNRFTAIAGFTAMGVLAASGTIALATFRPSAIEEPKYQGLLVNAPAVVGDAKAIANRYEEYRAELQKLVLNVSKLYSTISSLPVYEPDSSSIKVLHISDMHLNPAAWTVVSTVSSQFKVNMIVDTGDLNDWGSEPEASYVNTISTLRVPYIFVRGNHDSAVTAAAVARQPNATVLDGQIATVNGITFAGIGDPRFTPDKATDQGDVVDKRLVDDSGDHLVQIIRKSPKKVDVAMVHDPESANALAGVVPLVLAGHLHERQIHRLDNPPTPAPQKSGTSASPNISAPHERTLLMVEGSTGGAGLRGLEHADGPLPLALSILYFDKKHVLQAYDDIRVGGIGLTEVSLERHLVTPDAKAPHPSPSPSLSGSPSTSETPSPAATTSGP